MRTIVGILTLFNSLFPLKWEIEEIGETRGLSVLPELYIDTSNYLHFLTCGSEKFTHFYYDGKGWYKEVLGKDNLDGVLQVKWDASVRPHIISYIYYWPDSANICYGFWDDREWITQTVEKITGRSISYVYGIDLALDSKSYPYILYSFGDSSLHYNIKYARWNGERWVKEILIRREMPIWQIHRPVGGAPLVDDMGRLHFLYRDSSNFYYGLEDSLGLKSYLIDTPDTTGPFGFRLPGAGSMWGGDLRGYLKLDKYHHPCIGYKMFSGPFYTSKPLRVKISQECYNDVIKYAYWDGKRWNIQLVDSLMDCVPNVLDTRRVFIFKWDSKKYPHIIYWTFAPNDTSPIYYTKWDGNRWIKESIYDPKKPYKKLYACFVMDRNDTPHIIIKDAYTGSLLHAFGISEGTEGRERISGSSLKVYPNPTKSESEAWSL